MKRVLFTRTEINQKKLYAYVLLDENRKWCDLSLWPEDKVSLNQNIYVGKVSNILSNINAAFVQIGPKQQCFLPLSEALNPFYTSKPSKSDKLCIGDELLVQITKDAVKTKDPVASTKLILHGSYCFISTGNTKHGVSKKIEDDTKQHLLTLLRNWFEEWKLPFQNSEYGIVFRTCAKDVPEVLLKEDVFHLIQKLNLMLEEARHRNKYSLVYSDQNFFLEHLKQVNFNEIDEILTDQEDIYKELLDAKAEKASQICFYKDDAISLPTLYGFRSNLEEIRSNKVWLKSGGNIIIETLETLTAVDVNSGKALKKNDAFFLELNKEAAKEIARQLRLRDISGMIIIDFINLKSVSQQNELISCLKEELKKDHTSCNYIDITKLGLVEVTRKKVNRSLQEILKE